MRQTRAFPTGATLSRLRTEVFSASAEQGVVLLRQDGPTVFPPICPNCGRAARHPVDIRRTLPIHVPDSGDAPDNTINPIDRFDIPFCEECARRQAAASAAPGPWVPLRRVLSEGEGFGGVVALGIGFMFVPHAIRKLSIVPLLLAAMPWSTGFFLIRKVWRRSAHMAVPQPTEVGLAVDFTPLLWEAHEPAWRAFHFRLPAYAAQFRQANRERIWDPSSREAKSASELRRKDDSRSTWIFGIIFAIVILYGLWDEFFAGN